MAKGNILKEAIADAKAVREVALANAKAALEEAFTPKLQNMLSAKLSEDLDEDYYEEDMDNEGTMYDEDMYEEDVDLNLEDLMDEKDENDIVDDSTDNSEILDSDGMDEEVDLEEILNELEAEEDDSKNEETELEEAKPHYEADDVNKINPSADPNNIGYVHEDADFDLDALLEEISNLDNKVPVRKANQKKIAESARHKRIARRPVARKSPSRLNNFNNTIDSPAQVAYNALQEQKNGCKDYEQKLYEIKKSYSKVKKELNEVNLLNSKLLYVNRIFKANSLDNSQKLRVVETLDKAGSVKEAKLIYETIKDSFSISKDNKKVKMSRKTIKEGLGMASKASGISRTKTIAPKRAVISESDNMVSRFQKLANIKIKE